MQFDERISTGDAVSFLRRLADSLERNESVRVADTLINLGPELDIFLEYEEKNDGGELEIELTWMSGKRHRKGRIEIFAGRNASYYFRLKAPNGQIILTSVRYQSLAAAEKGVALLRECATEDRIAFCLSESDQPYFVLRGKGGDALGVSQMYTHRSSCLKGARSVLAHAAKAEVETLTPAE